MAIGCNETITSLDINFSNNGGHTATVTSVKGAKDLVTDTQENLGSLIGVGGGVTTFTNEKIQNILSNFTEVSRTVSQDARHTSISRSYEDTTNLLLKSHAVIVRGRDFDPNHRGGQGGGVFFQPNNFNVNLGNSNSYGGCASREKIPVNLPKRPIFGSGGRNARASASQTSDRVILPYFGEVIASPIGANLKFGYNAPTKSGALIYAGNIYNEESSIAIDGDKVSLVYQNGQLKENLSFNSDKVGHFYKQQPDYANYQLKYGYTLREVKTIFGLVGITVTGLPTSESILITESGSLDSILSSIASKFGYYWYADPFLAGRVVMVDSANSAQYTITNPLTQDGSLKAKYVNGSITTDYKTPKIVDVYSSTIERNETTFEIPDRDRLTRFHRWKPAYGADGEDGFIADLDFNKKILEVFFILFVSNKFQSSQLFTIYAYIATITYDLEWGKDWPDYTKLSKEGDWDTYDDIFNDEGEASEAMKTAGFDLVGAKLIPLFEKIEAGAKTIEKFEDVFNNDAFDKLKIYFEAITSNLYISNKFGRWKSTRMAFKNSPLSIEGPFQLTDKITETDGLGVFQTALKRNGKKIDQDELSTIWDDGQDAVGGGDFVFFGFNSKNNKNTKDLDPQDLKWKEICDEKAFFPPAKGGEGLIEPSTGKLFIAVSPDFVTKIKEMMEKSKKLFNEFLAQEETMKATYNRAKRPVSVPETEDEKKKQERDAKRRDALDARAQKLAELSERFDLRKYSIEKNGATGSPLHPIQLNVSNLNLPDVSSLKKSGISASISNQMPLQSSSRTISGLSLPSRFSLQMSSISLKLGSSGITTTINESAVKILRPDEQVILANDQASTSRNFVGFSAGQRNFMGL